MLQSGTCPLKRRCRSCVTPSRSRWGTATNVCTPGLLIFAEIKLHPIARLMLFTRESVVTSYAAINRGGSHLNIAYNAIDGGFVLDDIELRRNDATFLDALGARPARIR
jgi:hypothetical protein